MKTALLHPLSLVAVVCILAFTGGCSPFRPGARNPMPVALPETFVMYSEDDAPPEKWWESFGNPELNALVEEALAANLDIRVAWAQLRQVRATAVVSRADLYPSLDATGGYSNTREGGSDTAYSVTDSHSLGLGAGYEIDLWGRIEAEAASDDFDVRASREDLNTAAMTVAGEVVSKWVEIQAQRRKKYILQEQIKANENYVELIELRFRNALATALDVYQQRESLAKVKAELPPVESEERTLLHELAVLLGRPAGSVKIADAPLPVLPELPGLGFPSDLLANRPDIRSAGMQLRSADWSVAAARADRLPSVTLGLDFSYTGTQLNNLFNSWITELAGSVTGPIFDAGSRAAEVEKARGVVDQRLAEYKDTVITAFKEVQDALVQETWQKRTIDARAVQLEAARRNLTEAVSQYSQGLEDYLTVITAMLSVQDLEVSEVEDQADLILYRVALLRALGGSWTDELIAPAGSGREDNNEKNKG